MSTGTTVININNTSNFGKHLQVPTRTAVPIDNIFKSPPIESIKPTFLFSPSIAIDSLNLSKHNTNNNEPVIVQNQDFNSDGFCCCKEYNVEAFIVLLQTLGWYFVVLMSLYSVIISVSSIIVSNQIDEFISVKSRKPMSKSVKSRPKQNMEELEVPLTKRSKLDDASNSGSSSNKKSTKKTVHDFWANNKKNMDGNNNNNDNNDIDMNMNKDSGSRASQGYTPSNTKPTAGGKSGGSTPSITNTNTGHSTPKPSKLTTRKAAESVSMADYVKLKCELKQNQDTMEKMRKLNGKQNQKVIDMKKERDVAIKDIERFKQRIKDQKRTINNITVKEIESAGTKEELERIKANYNELVVEQQKLVQNASDNDMMMNNFKKAENDKVQELEKLNNICSNYQAEQIKLRQENQSLLDRIKELDTMRIIRQRAGNNNNNTAPLKGHGTGSEIGKNDEKMEEEHKIEDKMDIDDNGDGTGLAAKQQEKQEMNEIVLPGNNNNNPSEPTDNDPSGAYIKHLVSNLRGKDADLDDDIFWIKAIGIKVRASEKRIFDRKLDHLYTNGDAPEVPTWNMEGTPLGQLAVQWTEGNETPYIIALMEEKGIKIVNLPFGGVSGTYYAVTNGTKIRTLGIRDMDKNEIVGRPDNIAMAAALLAQSEGYEMNEMEAMKFQTISTQKDVCIVNVERQWGDVTVLMINSDGLAIDVLYKNGRKVPCNGTGIKMQAHLAKNPRKIIAKRADKDIKSSGIMEEHSLLIMVLCENSAKKEDKGKNRLNGHLYDTALGIQSNLNEEDEDESKKGSLFSKYKEDFMNLRAASWSAKNKNKYNKRGGRGGRGGSHKFGNRRY